MTLPFIILSAIIIATAIGVVLMPNPIHSSLCLIINLISVAGIFALLNAHFLAVVQVIVYAGAIMVLVVFVIMLLNIKEEDRKFSGWGLLALSVAFGIAFLRMLWPLLDGAFAQSIDIASVPVGTVEQIGKLLYSKYVFTFEAASILIMAAIVGAVMIAKTKHPKKGAA